MMCELHRSHSPKVHSCDRHHILPVSWGGEDEDNLAVICPTGHRSVHVLLRVLALHGEIPWEIGKSFGFAERRMAQDGYDRYVAREGRPEGKVRSVLAEFVSYSGGTVDDILAYPQAGES